MSPTTDFLHAAERRLRLALQVLRPQLLAAHGVIEHSRKADTSMVTEMDLAVEAKLRQVCHEMDAGIAFSGEETGVDYDRPTFWLIDPIDATEAFVRGLPTATTLITLIDNTQPVMGIIYNFFLDDYYLAIKGAGATRNGHVIRVSNRPLQRSYVVSSSGFSEAELVAGKGRLSELVGSVPRLNAAGFELSCVARGAYDARISWHTKAQPWDFAAGTLLIQEAGGRVENVHSSTYSYQDTNFVAANPTIFDELKHFVRTVLPAPTIPKLT